MDEIAADSDITELVMTLQRAEARFRNLAVKVHSLDLSALIISHSEASRAKGGIATDDGRLAASASHQHPDMQVSTCDGQN